LRETVADRKAAYYVGDERTESLQRQALASAMAEVLPDFDRVTYPDWGVLLERWWKESPRGAVLALDEFPSLVAAVPALPSLLQKRLDLAEGEGKHLVICGSSQRMMPGLVLHSSSPLFGRCREVLKIDPLPPRVVGEAFGLKSSIEALETWATWGGVPRYWELALDFDRRWEAVRELVLDPLGVLHREPARLLADDLREATQASSLLAVIGQGCRKQADMARRLERPATSLARPLHRLIELGIIRREQPFGVDPEKGKQSLYSIADPFVSFWYKFVDPNRSRLASGQVADVLSEVKKRFGEHLGQVWEDLARSRAHVLRIAGRQWEQAGRWWGRGKDGQPLEVDVVAHSADGRALLVGEVKVSTPQRNAGRVIEKLRRKIDLLPFALSKVVIPCLFYASERLAPDDCETVHVSEMLGAAGGTK